MSDDRPPERVADRYMRLERLGRGGVGEVWRYHDPVLGRRVALKVLQRSFSDATDLERFREEARVAAQLQHPGIIPVYDLGALEDGRLWYTMKEVRGPTLAERLDEVHRAWRLGRPEAASWFRGLVRVFHRVCETVAFAHAHGVMHRDLKPSNVMIADFGEVLVLDWGLSKLVADSARGPAGSDATRTQHGAVIGSPAYMAPEQARAEAQIGPAADVYGLGATLYELLCERPPRMLRSLPELLAQTAMGAQITAPSDRCEGVTVDPELEARCLEALAADPSARPTAHAMADAIGRWLDGELRRERALELVRGADAEAHAAATSLAESRECAARAHADLDRRAPNAPIDDKRAAWSELDRAEALRIAGEAARARALHALRAALSHSPGLTEAHDRLADHYHARHVALETAGDPSAHVALSDLAEHDRSGRYQRYLVGTGALTLHTEPSQASARLFRYRTVDRRLVPEPVRDLGPTPLEEVPVEMGTYVVMLEHPDCEPVTYPVHITRTHAWRSGPDGREGRPVRLPAKGTLGPDDCYVPPGWCLIGDDDFDHSLPRQRRWVDGFVVRRHPVTVGEYVAFLNDLVQSGQSASAEALQPNMGDVDHPFFARTDDGRFLGIRDDKEGWGWDRIPRSDRAPAVYLSFGMAEAYAAHLAEHTGVPWRLLGEAEWQKAGRGVDGRQYPWGDHFEPTWCRMRTTSSDLHFVEVDAMPQDVSPYGVCGLAGNVSDWTADASGDKRIRMGGHCGSGPQSCRLSVSRQATDPELAQATFSIRIARSIV